MAGKFFKYLPKSTSFSIPTSNNTNSPNKAHFSGPIVSIIPKEARRARRNDGGNDNGFEDQEPTSPKVTCIGRVKKHKNHEEKKKKDEKGPRKSGIRGMFQKKGRPPVAEAATKEVVPEMRKFASGRERMGEVVPEVGMMRKFASGRETFVDFDWRKFVAVDEEDGEKVRPPVAEVVPVMRKFASGRERTGEVVPKVGMMRKFASGRETLVDFDFRKFVAVGEEAGAAVVVGDRRRR